MALLRYRKIKIIQVMNISRLITRNLMVKPATLGKLQHYGMKSLSNANVRSNLDNVFSNKHHVRFVSTYEVKNEDKQEGLLKRVVKKIPFINFDKIKIKAHGYILYEEIVDNIDYFEFFKEFNLPDTFYSWFTVTEIYLWMLSVRAMAEGENGNVLRNAIIEALWNDVGQRVKMLNVGSLKSHVLELSEQMQAAFISYDEGIQSDDVVLAGAVWRRFYKMEHADPHNLEKFVHYIRKQISLLDSLSSDELFTKKSITWLPIKDS